MLTRRDASDARRSRTHLYFRGWFGTLKSLHVRAEQSNAHTHTAYFCPRTRSTPKHPWRTASAVHSLQPHARARWRGAVALAASLFRCSPRGPTPPTSACRMHHQVKVSAGAPRASFEHASLLTRPMPQASRPPRSLDALRPLSIDSSGSCNSNTPRPVVRQSRMRQCNQLWRPGSILSP